MRNILLILALFLRIALIANPGFEADISFWKSWGLATYDKGIIEGMKVTNNNYPTPFAYTLGAMVFLYSRFADPHAFNQFWQNTNILFLFVSKLFPILADFGIAGIILYIGKHAKRFGFPQRTDIFFELSFYELLAVFYILNPLSLIDGAWWGQVDSLGVCIFLLAVLATLKTQNFLAGFLFLLAMMTKLQNMIYAPLFFLFVWQKNGYKGMVHAITGAMVGFFGLNIEFFLSRSMDRVFASLTENYDYFPWMSLNAYNLWWIVSKANGMGMSDKISVLGLLNAKTVGLLLFSGMYLFSLIRQIRERTSVVRAFIESLIVVNAAFFLFQTQSHDRYAFPLAVFLLLWAPFQPNVKLFTIPYALFTLFYFYNMHTALVINYPNNGIPILSLVTQPFFTITTSIVLLLLFAVFLAALVRTSRATVSSLIIAGTLVFSAIGLLNLPLLMKQPVSLTTFTPYISEQAYGTRQTNLSVQSSFGGPHAWNRLSVQYAFYKTGIGSHANSKYVYDIGGHFKKFTVDYGIDTESGTKSSAVFEIYGDNTLLFRSDVMGRFDLPRHISVPLLGVKNLTLVTTDAGDGNYDDHTDWLHPELWPK